MSLDAGERAMKYFEHAIRIDRNSVVAHFGLAKLYEEYAVIPDHEERAIKEYLHVIELNSNHYKALTQVGMLLLKQERFEEAADKIKRAIAINKEYHPAQLVMGQLLLETGNAESAVKFFG